MKIIILVSLGFLFFSSSYAAPKKFFTVGVKIVYPDNEEKKYVFVPKDSEELFPLKTPNDFFCVVSGNFNEDKEKGLLGAILICTPKGKTGTQFSTIGMCGAEEGMLKLAQVKNKKSQTTLITLTCE